MRDNFVAEAEKVIGYTFKDKSLLIRAFTHSSYRNENKNFADYERLEFMGDAVLSLVISRYLFDLFPTANEGDLTKKRACLVSEQTLAKASDKLNLSSFMLTGEGGSHDNVDRLPSVKCDLFESVCGAIYIDSGGIAAAGKFILANLEPYVSEICADYKSMLSESCAKKRISLEFRTAPKSGGGFTAEIYLDGRLEASADGTGKKNAEKAAAQSYFTKNGTDNSPR